MKDLASKKTGDYLTYVGLVLVILSMIFYSLASNIDPQIQVLSGVAIVVQVIALALVYKFKKVNVANLLLVAIPVIIAGAFILSFRSQMDLLGYVVSGLYTFDAIQNYVISVVLDFVAIIVYVIASYQGYKEA